MESNHGNRFRNSKIAGTKEIQRRLLPGAQECSGLTVGNDKEHDLHPAIQAERIRGHAGGCGELNRAAVSRRRGRGGVSFAQGGGSTHTDTGKGKFWAMDFPVLRLLLTKSRLLGESQNEEVFIADCPLRTVRSCRNVVRTLSGILASLCKACLIFLLA